MNVNKCFTLNQAVSRFVKYIEAEYLDAQYDSNDSNSGIPLF